MRLHFRGKSATISNKEMRFALRFFCSQLMSPQLLRNIRVSFQWEEVAGEWGSIYPRRRSTSSWPYFTDRFPRSFLIKMTPVASRVGALRTAAHEAAHVEQYATGRLRDVGEDGMWRKRFIDCSAVPELELPWEREARRVERRLYKKYRDLLEKEGIRWQTHFQ